MGNGSRRQGRELALKAVYALRKDAAIDSQELMRLFWDNFRFQGGPLGEAEEDGGELPPVQTRLFAEELVAGIITNLELLDTTIEKYAKNWSLERMAKVDLALLRLAAYELIFRHETPIGVIINEAVELGKRFGTRETAAFVNGILDQVGKNERKDAPAASGN